MSVQTNHVAEAIPITLAKPPPVDNGSSIKQCRLRVSDDKRRMALAILLLGLGRVDSAVEILLPGATT